MKKFIIGAFTALAVAVVPATSIFAVDYPPCYVSADPTFHYDTVSFTCEQYTDRSTGITYNAIYIGVPHP